MKHTFLWLALFGLWWGTGCNSGAGPAERWLDTPSDLLEVCFQAPPSPMPILGTPVLLAVTVQGAPTPGPSSFQWLKDGTALEGAHGSQLLLPAVSRADAGSYQVQVTVRHQSFRTEPYLLEPVDQVWPVLNPADQGPGTLREVLTAANAQPGLNGILFQAPGPTVNEPVTIPLTASLPPITGQVCLFAPAGTQVTLDGGLACRPLFVAGGTLILDHFTLARGLGRGGRGPGGGGGAAGMGGAIFINAGTVDLRRMTFLGNRAVGGDSDPGGDGANGGGGGFGSDASAVLGTGGEGFAPGTGGTGYLDGLATNPEGNGGNGLVDGAGGGAVRGGNLDTALSAWATDMAGGTGGFGGGGGFSVGPAGGGGDGSDFGGGGGGSGGIFTGALQVAAPHAGFLVLPGAAGGAGGLFGGDGGVGDGVLPARGGGGAGLGGALFLRAGSLAMFDCTFTANLAIAGTGDPGAPAFAKGGAIFIYEFNLGSFSPGFDPAILQAQNYAQNFAADQADEPLHDNSNWYAAQQILTSAPLSVRRHLRTLGRLQRRTGLPVP